MVGIDPILRYRFKWISPGAEVIPRKHIFVLHIIGTTLQSMFKQHQHNRELCIFAQYF